MSEEVLRLGLDGRPLEQGSAASASALDKVAAAATRVAANTDKAESATSKLRDAYQSLRGPLQAIVAAFATSEIARFALSTVRASADIDSLKRGLVAVTGSAIEAERQFRDLAEVAKLPGLGFKEAIQGAVALEAAGLSAKEAKDALLAFGNAIATVGGGKEQLQSVETQLVQIAATGKVGAQDLRAIQNSVPQVRQALKEAFGTADTEELAKKGLSATEIIDGLTKELAKLPPVTTGLKNDMENLSDSFFKAKAAIGDVLAPAASKALSVLADLFTAISNLDTAKLTAELAALGRAVLATAGVLGTLAVAYKAATVAELTFTGANVAGVFLTLIPAITSAADAVTLLGFAFDGLNAALGPVGWIALGASALTAIFFKLQQDQIDAAAKADELKKAQEGLAGAFADVSKEAVKASVAVATAGTAQANAQIAALQAQIDEKKRILAEGTTHNTATTSEGFTISLGDSLTPEAKQAAADLKALLPELDKAKTHLAGYQAIIDGVNAALGRFAKEQAAASAQLDAAFKATAGELAISTEQQQRLAAAYKEGAAAGELMEFQIEAEKEAIEKSKGQPAARAAEILQMVEAEKLAAMQAEVAKKAAEDYADGIAKLGGNMRTFLASAASFRQQNASNFNGTPNGLTVVAPGLARDRAASGIDDALLDARQAADATKALFEEAARGIERSLADAFDSLLPHVDGAAGKILGVFEDLASQIAAAFAADALGIDKLLGDLQDRTKSIGDALEGAFGKTGSKAVGIGGGAVVGGLAGFESGNVGTGVASGALSGAALGSVVPGVGTAAGAVVGAVGGLVGGLLGGAEKAKEAARAMKAAQDAYVQSLDDLAADVAHAGGDFGKSVRDLRKELNDQFNSFLKDFPGVFGSQFGNFFHTGSKLSAQDQFGQLEEEIASLQRYVDSVTDPKARSALEETIEVMQAWADGVEKAQEEAKKAFDDDLAARMADAQGHHDQAEAIRRAATEQKEYTDTLTNFGQAAADQVKAVQEAEDAAAAAAKKAQNESDARSFYADLASRKAALSGTLSDQLDAIRAQYAVEKADAVKHAQELADAGAISQQAVADLAGTLDNQLAGALRDAAEAAKEAARSFEQNLNHDYLSALGDNEGAALAQAAADYQNTIGQIQDLFNQGAIDAAKEGDLAREALVVYRHAIDQIHQQFEGGGAADQAAADSASAAAKAHAASSETVKSVQAISETTAVRMTDILTGSNIWLSEIAFNTRALRGDGVGVFPGHAVGVAARPVAPAPAVAAAGGNIVVTIPGAQFFGTMTDADARKFADSVGRYVGQYLGQQTKQYGRLGGSAES